MIELRERLKAREADDRKTLLNIAKVLAAGGKAAGKVVVDELATLLDRLGLTPDDLDALVDLARERIEAARTAAPLADLQRAAREAMMRWKAADAERLAAVAKADAALAVAKQALDAAEHSMRVAGEAQARLAGLDRRLRLAAGVDADVDRRIVQLPSEIERVRESESVLQARLHTERTRLARAEKAIAFQADRTGDDELLRNELNTARSGVEALELELAALPALIAQKEQELNALQETVR